MAYDTQGVGSGAGVKTTNTVKPLNIIGSLAASRSSETAGTSFNLVASSVAEAGKTIIGVQFYREGNDAIGPQPGTGLDALIGAGTTSGSNTWTLAVDTSALSPGRYHYYAVATDNTGLRSSPVIAGNTVSDVPPVIGSFAINPASEVAGQNVTLTASNLTSPDVGGAIASVSFYRMSNAIVPAFRPARLEISLLARP